MRHLAKTIEDPEWQIPARDPAGQEWDVVVVGAGPAGSIAATWLAKFGYRVLILDKYRFPRDKTCGDALIPDSLRVLRRARVLDAVEDLGHRLSEASVFSPSQIEVSVPGEYVTIRRRILDALLAHKAVNNGAVFCQGVVSEVTTEPDGRVAFHVRGVPKPYVARFGVLATGASVDLLNQAGMLERAAPSALAVRSYVNSTAGIDRLVVSYDRSIAPGYAWIFPLGNQEYNVGCGVFYRKATQKKINLKEMFHRFLSEFPMGRQILNGMRRMTPLTGAPLRCSLSGARIIKGNIVAIGETIGATFPFTGEGIGKAMETAELAAKAIDAAFRSGTLEEFRRLPSRLHEILLPRYHGYEIAERWISRPWLSDLLAWRASRSAALRKLMSGVVTESVDPSRVFSLRGLLHSLWG